MSPCHYCHNFPFGFGESTAAGEQKPFQPTSSVIVTEWAMGHLLCLLYQKHPLGHSQRAQCVRVCVCVRPHTTQISQRSRWT